LIRIDRAERCTNATYHFPATEANLYIGTRAQQTPDKPAVVNASTGQFLTYRELDRRSVQIASLLREHGLQRGDRVAVFMENHLEYMAVVWAALRAGLYAVPINRYFNLDELVYVLDDCGAKAVFASFSQSATAGQIADQVPACGLRVMVGGCVPGWQPYEALVEQQGSASLLDESMGATMSYTSGTTGRPKGVLRPLQDGPAALQWPGWHETGGLYGFDASTVYLSPAPFYHAAPMRFARATHMAGGTLVFMEKFDAELSLQLIERYRVTHSQWVPTMFVRMLKLDDAVRSRYDLSSQRVAIHAAAPCPVDVKRRMIDWWGPIIDEYYGSSDGNGITSISCQEWLDHPGSVGRARPEQVKICAEDGTEQPPGVPGLIYLVGYGPLPQYLNDPVKTKAARHAQHDNWITGGDVGYIGEDGFLYLTDRKAFTIISGGVNIYPQAIEDALIEHPLVGDAAVFGVPNDEMGEEVKALVELTTGTPGSDALARQLIAYCATKMARYMVPRSLEFVEQLPRTPTGKLMKKELRDKYWAGRTRAI